MGLLRIWRTFWRLHKDWIWLIVHVELVGIHNACNCLDICIGIRIQLFFRLLSFIHRVSMCWDIVWKFQIYTIHFFSLIHFGISLHLSIFICFMVFSSFFALLRVGLVYLVLRCFFALFITPVRCHLLVFCEILVTVQRGQAALGSWFLLLFSAINAFSCTAKPIGNGLYEIQIGILLLLLLLHFCHIL